MKLKGTFSVDIRRFEIKSDSSNTGKEALVDIEIGLKQEEAEKKIGEDFVALAFSTMRVQENDEGEDGYHHLVDSIKPGRNCILEQHRITIDDQPEFVAQPELLRIKPVDGEPKVTALIRIPIDVSKAAVINALTKLVGESVKVKLNAAQGELAFSGGNGNGKHAGGEDGDDGTEAAAAQ